MKMCWECGKSVDTKNDNHVIRVYNEHNTTYIFHMECHDKL